MALVVPNNGEADGLKYFVNKEAPQDLVLRLFKNDVTPGDADTAAAFTEATFTGYAAITLVGANWAAPVEGDPTSIAYAQQSFTSSAAQALQNIYGWYMTRAASGRIAAAERFTNGPYPISNDGDFVKVTPTLTKS